MTVPSPHERRAILMIAIGARPWAGRTADLFRAYAKTCRADFILVDRVPDADAFPFGPMPDHPGRSHKIVFASKAFLPWQLMAREGYDRVLVVDDSCCVRPDAPDIFAYAPVGRCGVTGTSHAHAEMTFGTIRAFLAARNLPDIRYDPAEYMNSGVMLYDSSFKDALAPERILAARDLLYAAYPHQTLTYYLLKSADVPIALLPKSFNRLPAADLPPKRWTNMTDVLPFVGAGDDTHIYHVTGAFKRRDVILPALAAHLLDGGTAGPVARPARRPASARGLARDAVAGVTRWMRGHRLIAAGPGGNHGGAAE